MQVHGRAGMIVVVWMEFCPFQEINSYFAVMLMLDLLRLLYALGFWKIIWSILKENVCRYEISVKKKTNTMT